MSVKNSLSTLLGNYMSDSENENDENKNSFSKEIGNLIDEIGGESTNKLENLPKTEWTQCMDVNTGHPYYWNISTKEVTWEKPIEYENFLKEIKIIIKKLPDDSWEIGFTEAQTPYYMNIFTREISWVKPENYKEKKKLKKPKKRKHKNINDKESVTQTKKKYPKHLESGSDEELKIELINSFSNKSASSSDDEQKHKTIKTTANHKVTQSKLEIQKQTKINLVAAYSTDDEEDIVIENKSQNTGDNDIKPANIESPESSQASQKCSVKNEKPKLTSFASIITGGKVDGEFDEEINKLKEELEKDLAKTEVIDDETIDENNTNNSAIVNSTENFDKKIFKRKRRIELGTNGKNTQSNDETENEDSRPSFVLTNSEDSKENLNSEKILAKKKLYNNFTRSHFEFVKINEECNNEKNNEKQENKDEKIELENEIKNLSDVIFGKVKFLSVGHFEVSAVQAINIQLETLLAAFKSTSLTIEYFFKWLKQTSDDLIKLEQNAAPDGWKCKWDRATSQYCYENLTTNEIRWEFPSSNESEGNSIKNDDTNDNVNTNDKNLDNEVENLIAKENKNSEDKSSGKINDDVKGEIEMDICTTPPPNENEKIIVQHSWDADNAPPPPRITTPSPPVLSTSVIINDELSAFYSDIAKISSETPEQSSNDKNINSSTSNSHNIENAGNDKDLQSQLQQQFLIEKKKRKKVKVAGSSMGDKGVSEMVAKWQKAQQQKGYNFW